MSELDGQLRAQGGPCEHLAKLFEYKRGMAEGEFPCPSLSTTPWTDALTQLLARIDELEADLERFVGQDEWSLALQLKQAEAEAGRWSEKFAALHARFAQQQTRLERAHVNRDGWMQDSEENRGRMLKAEAALAERDKKLSAALGAVDFWQTAEEEAQVKLAERGELRCTSCDDEAECSILTAVCEHSDWEIEDSYQFGCCLHTDLRARAEEGSET